LEELAQRPNVTSDLIRRILVPILGSAAVTHIESAIADNLYAGYIRMQESAIQRLRHHDSIPIPQNLDFKTLNGLSHEMIERLERSRPSTVGDARRIAGLTPAALSTLYVASSTHS
jgi:tRNA uridine 5-carboxymethylaminomethyl modification enzyme